MEENTNTIHSPDANDAVGQHVQPETRAQDPAQAQVQAEVQARGSAEAVGAGAAPAMAASGGGTTTTAAADDGGSGGADGAADIAPQGGSGGTGAGSGGGVGIGGSGGVSYSSGGTAPDPTTAPPSAVPKFVAPSSYLRPKISQRSAMTSNEPKPPSPLDKEQLQGLVSLTRSCDRCPVFGQAGPTRGPLVERSGGIEC